MRIPCERHVPPKYIHALESETWVDVTTTATQFHPEAPDETIARYAVENGWLVLTRDRDFFELATRLGCGVFYLDMSRNPAPGILVDAIQAIDDAYNDQAEILESIPGDWV